MRIPQPDVLACPACGSQLAVRQRRAGERFSCPQCLTTLTLLQIAQGLQLSCSTSEPRKSVSRKTLQPTVSAITRPIPAKREIARTASTLRATISVPTAIPDIVVIRPISPPPDDGVPDSSSRKLAPQPIASGPASPVTYPAPVTFPPGNSKSSSPVLNQGNTKTSKRSGRPRKRALLLLFATALTIAAVAFARQISWFVLPQEFVATLFLQAPRTESSAATSKNSTATEIASTPEQGEQSKSASENTRSETSRDASSNQPANSRTETTPLADATVTNSTDLEPSEIVQRCEPSVCLLMTPWGSLGTGFVVGPGIVASNEHVVGLAAPNSVVIEFPSRHDARFTSVELAYAAPQVDLLLLRVRDLPADYRPLTVTKTAQLKKGERLLVIGNPGGLKNVVTQGLFGSMQKYDGANYVQLSLSVNPGNSGGPALTSRGMVAGIVTMKSEQEGIGLAIPGDVLQSALQAISDCSAEELEQNVARWQARQLGTKLIVGCRMSANLVQTYRTAGTQARDRGTDTRRAIEKAYSDEQQRVAVLGRLARDIMVSFDWVKTSKLEREDKELLGRLDACFRVLSQWAQKPVDSWTPPESEDAGALQQLPVLEQRLKSTLGMLARESELTMTLGRN